jgi:hypothetical protein
LRVGATTTQLGWILGNFEDSFSGIWSSAVTPSGTNYILYEGGQITYLRGVAGVRFYTGTSWKVGLLDTAGYGVSITAGQAATDVNAISVTQTWSNAAVAFTALKLVATDTASAAGALLMDLQTAGGGTQFKVRKDGLLSTGGTDVVASFGPAIPLSITVKNGLITAIS